MLILISRLSILQFHQDAAHKAMIAPLLKQPNMNLIEYDGCAEFHAKDADHFLKFMDGIYNSKNLVGMCLSFHWYMGR
jgi:hypothetical protein